jgi:hypothetical protein
MTGASGIGVRSASSWSLSESALARRAYHSVALAVRSLLELWAVLSSSVSVSVSVLAVSMLCLLHEAREVEA